MKSLVFQLYFISINYCSYSYIYRGGEPPVPLIIRCRVTSHTAFNQKKNIGVAEGLIAYITIIFSSHKVNMNRQQAVIHIYIYKYDPLWSYHMISDWSSHYHNSGSLIFCSPEQDTISLFRFTVKYLSIFCIKLANWPWKRCILIELKFNICNVNVFCVLSHVLFYSFQFRAQIRFLPYSSGVRTWGIVSKSYQKAYLHI